MWYLTSAATLRLGQEGKACTKGAAVSRCLSLNYSKVNDISFPPPETVVITSALEGQKGHRCTVEYHEASLLSLDHEVLHLSNMRHRFILFMPTYDLTPALHT